jgi:RNA polymerase sigma-70 factor (ECF subfamily)
MLGFEAVMTQYGHIAAVLQKYPSTLVRFGFVNGLPGFVTREGDGELQTTALDIADGKIVAIYVMRNPDKLGHLH